MTGYTRNLYHKYQKGVTGPDFFGKFDKIAWNGEYFEFTYDLKKLTTRKKEELPEKTVWTVGSPVTRSVYDRQKKKYKQLNINEELVALIQETGLEWKGKMNLAPSMGDGDKWTERQVKRLLDLFNLLLNMRVTDKADPSSESTDDSDYIQSPVEPFYCSRGLKGEKFPNNGDANGAYNIARKGIVFLEKLKAADISGENDSRKIFSILKDCLKVPRKDWLNFTQRDDVIREQVKRYQKPQK